VAVARHASMKVEGCRVGQKVVALARPKLVEDTMRNF
jgi:hypothetical protein